MSRCGAPEQAARRKHDPAGTGVRRSNTADAWGLSERLRVARMRREIGLRETRLRWPNR